MHLTLEAEEILMICYPLRPCTSCPHCHAYCQESVDSFSQRSEKNSQSMARADFTQAFSISECFRFLSSSMAFSARSFPALAIWRESSASATSGWISTRGTLASLATATLLPECWPGSSHLPLQQLLLLTLHV